MRAFMILRMEGSARVFRDIECCQPVFVLFCNRSESTFLELLGVDIYGYDAKFFEANNYNYCKNLCLEDCNCKGFQYFHTMMPRTFTIATPRCNCLTTAEHPVSKEQYT